MSRAGQIKEMEERDKISRDSEREKSKKKKGRHRTAVDAGSCLDSRNLLASSVIVDSS